MEAAQAELGLLLLADIGEQLQDLHLSDLIGNGLARSRGKESGLRVSRGGVQGNHAAEIFGALFNSEFAQSEPGTVIKEPGL